MHLGAAHLIRRTDRPVQSSGMTGSSSSAGTFRATLVWESQSRSRWCFAFAHRSFTRGSCSRTSKAGNIIRKHPDHAPVGDSCPTSTWKPGDVLVDRFSTTLPVPGAYPLKIGFFRPGENDGPWAEHRRPRRCCWRRAWYCDCVTTLTMPSSARRRDGLRCSDSRRSRRWARFREWGTPCTSWM